jgi:hypothetical protein
LIFKETRKQGSGSGSGSGSRILYNYSSRQLLRALWAYQPANTSILEDTAVCGGQIATMADDLEQVCMKGGSIVHIAVRVPLTRLPAHSTAKLTPAPISLTHSLDYASMASTGTPLSDHYWSEGALHPLCGAHIQVPPPSTYACACVYTGHIRPTSTAPSLHTI